MQNFLNALIFYFGISSIFYFILPYLCCLYFVQKGSRRHAFFGFSWLIWLLSFISTLVHSVQTFDDVNLPITTSIWGGLFVTAFIPNLFGLIWLIHKYKKYKSKKLQNINRRN